MMGLYCSLTLALFVPQEGRLLGFSITATVNVFCSIGLLVGRIFFFKLKKHLKAYRDLSYDGIICQIWRGILGFFIMEICYGSFYRISRHDRFAIFESSDMALKLEFHEKNGYSIALC